MSLILQRASYGREERPYLVWLHGLLGSVADWQALLPAFAHWPCATVDLPGHGVAQEQRVTDFSELDRMLRHSLQQQGIRRYWLIGYSLGGRVALYHACVQRPTGICGVIVEGGHPGLRSEQQRLDRLQHDIRWATRFRQEPLIDVLTDWYRQPVFSDLTPQVRSALIERRSHNQGSGVAALLEATSLGKQPWLGMAIQQRDWPLGYLCGERDSKFQALAKQEQLPLLTISAAGHNAHLANPSGFITQLNAFLAHHL